MNLFKRYNLGEQETVWQEIYGYNSNLVQENYDDIILVLNETMCRIEYNLNFIKKHLEYRYGYKFSDTKEKEIDIKKLEKKVLNWGFIPLSLIFFYKHIGSIDLSQKKEAENKIYLGDPLYIESIDGVFELLDDGSWEEAMEEKMEDEPYSLIISPDLFHKENLSGGQSYSIELTPAKKIDSFILNTKYGNLYFIEYLRLCFLYGGFPNFLEFNKDENSYLEFMRANLKKI